MTGSTPEPASPYHLGDIKESIMSKRKLKKRIAKKLLKKQKRSSVPNKQPVDTSKEKNFKFSNPRHRWATPEDRKKYFSDTEEELIIFL